MWTVAVTGSVFSPLTVTDDTEYEMDTTVKSSTTAPAGLASRTRLPVTVDSVHTTATKRRLPVVIIWCLRDRGHRIDPMLV